MGKNKTITLAPANGAASYNAKKAAELRRDGFDYEAIAAELELESAWDASQLVSIGLAQIQSETGDQMRATSELRILDVIRKAQADLAITKSQPMRNALYKIILGADAQLSKLYGLELPLGLPDSHDGEGI